MKEFDKWWEDNWWKLEDGGNEFNATKAAWVAALKWALTQEQSVSGLLPDMTVAIIPSLDIRRELNGNAEGWGRV